MKLSQTSLSLLENTIKKAVSRYNCACDQAIVTDIHLQVTPNIGELSIYNDDDEVLANTTIEEWGTYDGNDFNKDIERILSGLLNDMKNAGDFDKMTILKPFSFVLVDEDKETLAELLLIDDDTLLVNEELLKGLDEGVMRDIAEHLPIMDGAERLMGILKKIGMKIAILSGGFTYFGEYLKRKFGIDYVYANELEIEDGKLTGRYLGEIVDGKRKAELLRLLAQVEKVDIAQTIAVGDGANDLPMLSTAGLGIAFHAKPKVVENAEQSINTIGLDGVLYFLGFKDSYLDEKGKL